MANDVKIEAEGVLKLLTETIKKIEDTDRLLAKMSSFVISQILARTAQGKDVEGNDFDDYSPAYAAFRKKAGRPTDKVDLFFTGKMLGSITHKVEEDKATIFFAGADESEKAYWVNQGRNFFGISPSDEDRLREMVVEAILG